MEIEHRVQTLEVNHGAFTSEMRRMNTTLEKIESSIEKQNEIHTDVRLLRQEFQGHAMREDETIRRQNERIERLESIISRLNWMIVSAVVAALLALVIKGA